MASQTLNPGGGGGERNTGYLVRLYVPAYTMIIIIIITQSDPVTYIHILYIYYYMMMSV